MFIKSLQNRDKPKIRRLLQHYLEDNCQRVPANALWYCNTSFLPSADYPFEEKTCALVDHGKTTVGFATMDQTGTIEMLCVHRDYRNRNVGLALLKFLVRAARKSGVLQLTVQSQENAIGFFEKLGFEQAPEPDGHDNAPNMTKSLILDESEPAAQN